MDREEKKRKQKFWVVVAEILMVLAVIAIVTIMTLVAMGYNLGRDGEIEQSGLLQLHTLPTGASVEIDGSSLFSRTDLSRTLSPGEHTIKVTKDGYDSWEKTISMESGVLMRLYYPRLFLTERTEETVEKLPELALYSAAVNRRSILYATIGATTWNIISIEGDSTKKSTVDLSGVLSVEEDGRMAGVIANVTWSDNGNRVLVEMLEGGARVWYLMDLERPKDSVNLTKEFGLDFEKMRLANASAGQILALENGNLRKIDVDGRSMTRILVSGVEGFTNHGADVIYVAKNNAEVQEIGIYEDGAKGSVIVGVSDEAGKVEKMTFGAEEKVLVASSAYYDEEYLIYSVGSRLVVYKGQFPQYQTDNNVVDLTTDGKMELFYEGDLGVTGELTVSRGGEYVVMRNGAQMAILDLDTKMVRRYEASVAELNWLDDSMMYGVVGGVLSVWDFDGENQRELASDAIDYDVVISKNNNYLYFVRVDGTLVRERIQ